MRDCRGRGLRGEHFSTVCRCFVCSDPTFCAVVNSVVHVVVVVVVVCCRLLFLLLRWWLLFVFLFSFFISYLLLFFAHFWGKRTSRLAPVKVFDATSENTLGKMCDIHSCEHTCTTALFGRQFWQANCGRPFAKNCPTYESMPMYQRFCRISRGIQADDSLRLVSYGVSHRTTHAISHGIRDISHGIWDMPKGYGICPMGYETCPKVYGIHYMGDGIQLEIRIPLI